MSKAVERILVQKLIEAHESGDAAAIERSERAVAEAGINLGTWRPAPYEAPIQEVKPEEKPDPMRLTPETRAALVKYINIRLGDDWRTQGDLVTYLRANLPEGKVFLVDDYAVFVVDGVLNVTDYETV